MTVHVSLLKNHNGSQIACLALSAPERINAQNLAMVRQMSAALAQWRDDESIMAIVLIGAGERGFCAGGDLKTLYQAMSEPAHIEQGDAFFREEYRLCQSIREYPKPVLAWGYGIVMGGGWGLFAAASHRVVTESSRLAMPETGIGLFPDVAASWWLPKLNGAGRFLGLTGAAINARDALELGAADFLLPDATRHETLIALEALPWTSSAQQNAFLLSEFLSARSQQLQHLEPQLMRYEAHYQALNQFELPQALDYLAQWVDESATDSAYLLHVSQRIRKASPTSLYLSWALQAKCAALTMAKTVDIEIAMAACALRYGDFAAGIYSTLIDRQSSPRWQFADWHLLDGAHIQSHFWPLRHE
ncbi:enoyl-CoA hydratase/isomerase family protein [Chitinibacter sp. SCUT-21]|uniref:enoyl-CoA hydratase/isomerase family protein n=1 Tax=Chitinibacter sp. SCUT-21 TaxID=2970891 RepID=UPI0035A60F56